MSKNNPWAYSIDYDAEIMLDEARVAYLSSDFAIKTAAAVEELCATNTHYESCQLDALLIAKPELAELLGWTKDDLRAFFCAADYYTNPELEAELQAKYGEFMPTDYRHGVHLWEKALCIVPDCKSWGEWRSIRETGKRGRAEQLKHAKSTLSRHRRNKEKFAK